MLARLGRRWWQALRRRGRLHPVIDTALWQATLQRFPALAGLDAGEAERLRRLGERFLRIKVIEPAQGAELEDATRVAIAALGCLPILNLGLGCYRDWNAVVVYPAGFIARQEWVDAAGVVHSAERPLIGEAWERGPVILSAEDVVQAEYGEGVNVVLHEFAHKLDMLNGEPNGHPPLHRSMSVAAWTSAFSAAFADLQARVAAGDETALDPYASEAPEEFFAVATEAFFETPWLLAEGYPEVYAQLRAYYRQEPLERFEAAPV